MLKNTALIFSLVMPCVTFAGTVTTKINHVGCTASTNICRAVLNDPIPNSSCTYSNYVTWGATTSELSNKFLSIAMAAAASKSDVVITANGPCILDGQETLDEIMLKTP